MKIKFSHISIKANNIEEMKNFFTNILNLRVGERPPFAFDGYWLYDNTLNEPIVHIVGKRGVDIVQGNNIDHIAFESKGIDNFIKKLKDKNIEYVKQIITGTKITQIFVYAPEGLKVEINFE
jgi:catechol 2,3-dioxygenase-like lactoylglutathione lyase family enzyme